MGIEPTRNSFSNPATGLKPAAVTRPANTPEKSPELSNHNQIESTSRVVAEGQLGPGTSFWPAALYTKGFVGPWMTGGYCCEVPLRKLFLKDSQSIRLSTTAQFRENVFDVFDSITDRDSCPFFIKRKINGGFNLVQ